MTDKLNDIEPVMPFGTSQETTVPVTPKVTIGEEKDAEGLLHLNLDQVTPMAVTDDTLAETNDLKKQIEDIVDAKIKASQEIQKFVFVSDRDLPADLEERINQFGKVFSFDNKLFMNRKWEDLAKVETFSHVWLNLANSDCKSWLQEHLEGCDPFWGVAAYKVNKKSKWLNDVKDIIKVVCKFDNLTDITALTRSELEEKIKNGIRYIHSPPSRLASLCGCSKNVKNE